MPTTISSINSLREKAKTFLNDHKFPSGSDESFRFTSLRKYFTEEVKPFSGSLEKSNQNPAFFEQAKGAKLVFINGFFSKEQSVLSNDFEWHTDCAEQDFLGKATVEPNYFTEQNSANFSEICCLKITKTVAEPITVFFVNTTTDVTFPRLLAVAKTGVEATINVLFSSNISAQKSYVNSVAEIFLESNAQVHFNLVEKDNPNVVLTNTIEAVCERDARFYLTSYIKNSLFVRNDVHVRLTGKNAYADLNGFYETNGNELADNHILIDHQVPDCESSQLYKGLLHSESTGVFNGCIMVRKNAQRTNAYQSSKAVLLSDSAVAHSMPQLEIFADDVKCSHGAAIGQLNKDQLFYFKARGIDEKTAKKMLNFAYTVEVLEKINDQNLRQYLLWELREGE